jgi:hypothetical protein
MQILTLNNQKVHTARKLITKYAYADHKLTKIRRILELQYSN